MPPFAYSSNEDMLAVHIVSRAAFRVLYDLTKDDAVIKQALDAHIKKVGLKRFNEETNFLKHADQDPAGEIDENFHPFTEAGIGMAIGLFKHHDKNLTAEMAAFLAWSAIMRPGFYDLSEATNQLLEEWRKNSRTDPTQVTDADKKMYYGDAILYWTRLNWKALSAKQKAKNEAEAAAAVSKC
jgi:hypothetical protein